jgi:hypothetical protein
MSNPHLIQPAATWAQRVATAVLAGLALGGAVFWVMQILALGRADPHVRFVAEPAPAGEPAPLARILGGDGVPALASGPPGSSLTLVAVIARGSQAGSAMISINGQKAQPFRPGDEVQAGRHVLELGPRSVALGPSPHGPVVEVLELKIPRLPE